MGAECCFYDPYVHESEGHSTKISLEEMFQTCDVVAVNCHVSRETINLVNYELLSNSSVKVLVNTARGEIVDSPSVLRHLSEDKGFTFAADVLPEEQDQNIRNELIDLFRQFLLTSNFNTPPRGMTFDARAIAYQKAADLLSIWLQKSTQTASVTKNLNQLVDLIRLGSISQAFWVSCLVLFSTVIEISLPRRCKPIQPNNHLYSFDADLCHWAILSCRCLVFGRY